MVTPFTSKTTNQLHFEDLDPKRFEALIAAFILRYKSWYRFNHFGEKGCDDGVDFEAIEEIDEENRRQWVFQCKRYSSISLSQMKGTIDALKTIPDAFVLITACSITKNNIDQFTKYANERGIKQVFVITKNELEAILYAKHPDLLLTFFGLDINNIESTQINKIKRDLSIKEALHRDLLWAAQDYERMRDKSLLPPRDGFTSPMLLIRSINATNYPEINMVGLPLFFKVAPHSFYYNGLAVMMDYRVSVLVDYTTGNWEAGDFYSGKMKEKYTEKGGYLIGYIPYSNIITYDTIGDEYYNIPHIFCLFSYQNDYGTHPFERFGYGLERGNYYYIFDDDKRGLE